MTKTDQAISTFNPNGCNTHPNYEAYFDTNFAAIDKGDELPPISVFW
ncbi:hypothetical protein [Shewanella morhuae]|nr:hypothetical protein [Shewanella morhuae]GIU11684.1 hypothetical protein TUM4641_29960 [Shewanella morhuae]